MMALRPDQLSLIALGLGVVGFLCLAGPVLLRLSGRAKAEPLGSGTSLRSPLWWVGFLLTIAAIFLQRMAGQQG